MRARASCIWRRRSAALTSAETPYWRSLVLDLLLGHHQLLLVAAPLPGVVDDADQQVGEGGALRDRERAVPARHAERQRRRCRPRRRGLSFPGSSASAATAPTTADLRDRLDRFEDGVGTEQVLQARGRVDAVKVQLPAPLGSGGSRPARRPASTPADRQRRRSARRASRIVESAMCISSFSPAAVVARCGSAISPKHLAKRGGAGARRSCGPRC